MAEREVDWDVDENPVLTSGQAARVARVAPRTLAKWCDAGMLPHHRLMGRYGDRRIQLSDLVAFCQQHHVPLDRLWREVGCFVLLAGSPSGTAARVHDAYPTFPRLQVEEASNHTQAVALACRSTLWGVVWWSVGAGRGEGLSFGRWLVKREPCPSVRAVVLSDEDGNGDEWREAGYTHLLPAQTGEAEIVALVGEALQWRR